MKSSCSYWDMLLLLAISWMLLLDFFIFLDSWLIAPNDRDPCSDLEESLDFNPLLISYWSRISILTVTEPPRFVNFIELDRKLRRICRILFSSPSIASIN